MVSIQSSHTSPSNYKCSCPSRNLMSCSFLTPWLYPLSCFFCGDVICGISSLFSLGCLSYGNVIYGIVAICLIAYTIIGTAFTTIGIVGCSILPLIIFYALKYMLSCSLFTPQLEALPSSTLFFRSIALLREFDTAFFLFSSAVYTSSLVLLTLVGGSCGLSF